MNKRIDNLTPGSPVLLRLFRGSYIDSEEPATFLRIEGEGEARAAWFRTHLSDGSHYDWHAYRFQGHWAYGSSADLLQLWKILSVEESATMPDKLAEPAAKNPIIAAYEHDLATVNAPDRTEDYWEGDRNVRGVSARWIWYLMTGNQEVSSDPEILKDALWQLTKINSEAPAPERRAPFDIADKLVVEWLSPENYSNDDQEIKLTARSLRGLLIEAATQARAS